MLAQVYFIKAPIKRTRHLLSIMSTSVKNKKEQPISFIQYLWMSRRKPMLTLKTISMVHFCSFYVELLLNWQFWEIAANTFVWIALYESLCDFCIPSVNFQAYNLNWKNGYCTNAHISWIICRTVQSLYRRPIAKWKKHQISTNTNEAILFLLLPPRLRTSPMLMATYLSILIA